MPESNETLSDQVENDQAQPENEQPLPGGGPQPESEEAQTESADSQPVNEQAPPETEQAQPEIKEAQTESELTQPGSEETQQELQSEQAPPETEQAQPEIKEAQLESEQAPPEREQSQSENEEGQPESEQAPPESKPDKKTAERKKAKEALKSISPPAGRRKRRQYSEDDVLLRFTSCGRCGLFLTTYRLSHNQEFLEAIEEIEADWLIFPWHPDMREMVNKSYGSPVDIESYYLEGSCPECYRPFSFAEPNPDQPAWFLVKL